MTQDDVRKVAEGHGLLELSRARQQWQGVLNRYIDVGYPALVWEEAIQADYVMLPLLDAAIQHKVQHQLPA